MVRILRRMNSLTQTVEAGASVAPWPDYLFVEKPMLGSVRIGPDLATWAHVIARHCCESSTHN